MNGILEGIHFPNIQKRVKLTEGPLNHSVFPGRWKGYDLKNKIWEIFGRLKLLVAVLFFVFLVLTSPKTNENIKYQISSKKGPFI